jgi:hypothetical protein
MKLLSPDVNLRLIAIQSYGIAHEICERVSLGNVPLAIPGITGPPRHCRFRNESRDHTGS